MEENENKEEQSKSKLGAFFSVKRNKIITCAVGGVLAVGIILGITLPLTLNKNQNSSSGKPVEITAEKWDAAFKEVPNNFTFKCDVDNVTRGFAQHSDNGIHVATYDSNGNVYKTKEEYIEWTTSKNYIYSFNDTTNAWEKQEISDEDVSKEYYYNYYKVQLTFIGRFSDFSYDANKGGYFASSTKTTEITVDGETDGGYEVKNVLVQFNDSKISNVSFQYNGNYGDGEATAYYSLTSIGSTTFTFPTIYA